jgi:hypothetical protein
LLWRVETYSSKPAETLTTGDVFGFLWAERWELLRYLAWTDEINREARKRD